MSIDLDLMHEYWMESSLLWQDGQPVLPPEWDSREALMAIRKVMVDLARSNGDLFRIPTRVRKDRRRISTNRLGLKLESCLGLDVLRIYKSFPQHRFDPYFTLFAETYVASPLWRDESLRNDVDQLNQLVDDLRAGSKRSGFMKTLANHERGTIKNTKTVEAYLAALYRDYPKILHVRLDLSYPCAFGWFRHGVPADSVKQMKSDRERFMRHVRKEFRRVFIGHLWTAEFGEFTGPHFHVFLHFDGQEVRRSIAMARKLGEHWKNVTTSGRGGYWNVNALEHLYEARGKRGIGLISHSDEKRRENLLKASLYLVKTDLFVRMVMPGFGKTFGHGRFRPRVKSNAGRKRKGERFVAAVDAIRARRAGVGRD
jgi:hypothetical protein